MKRGAATKINQMIKASLASASVNSIHVRKIDGRSTRNDGVSTAEDS